MWIVIMIHEGWAWDSWLHFSYFFSFRHKICVSSQWEKKSNLNVIFLNRLTCKCPFDYWMTVFNWGICMQYIIKGNRNWQWCTHYTPIISQTHIFFLFRGFYYGKINCMSILNEISLMNILQFFLVQTKLFKQCFLIIIVHDDKNLISSCLNIHMNLIYFIKISRKGMYWSICCE